MIEVTDEMREAFQVAAGWPGPPWRFGPDVANGLAAVLAIVERTHSSCIQSRPLCGTGEDRVWPQDRATDVTWGEVEPAPAAPGVWRCNRTERCFREDGHPGPHGFAGQPVTGTAT